MKKDKIMFIKRGILFWTVFAISLVLVTVAFNHVNFQHSYSFKKADTFDRFVSKNSYIDYLFVGDSHAESAIYPSKISSRSFNWAVSGENYRENYYKLKSLFERKIKAEYIILEVDDTMLDTPGRFEKEIYFVRRYISFNDLIGLSPQAIINYYFGFIGRGTFFGLAVTGGKPIDEFGFSINNRTIGEDSERQIIGKEAEDATYEVPKYLTKIIELSRQKNQKIIFIKYPLLPEDQNHPRHDKMIRDYLKNETILDYRTVFDNNRTLFQDLNHLNIQGASILSLQIKEDLETLKE